MVGQLTTAIASNRSGHYASSLLTRSILPSRLILPSNGRDRRQYSLRRLTEG